jgi:two-component system sensor histidine kinase DegS
LKQASFTFSNPHFWILVAMFVIGVIFHYPQQLLGIEAPSILSFLGLTQFAVERTLFLVPITYAGMFFGFRAGITALVISLIIILPRVFFTSEIRAEALLQSGAVIILGLLVNLWFETKRKESALYQQLVARLEESERGMSVSEQKYRYLFENASDAIWVQDVDGYLVDGNRAFERLTGLKVAEVKGTHLAKFLSDESLALAREVRNKLANGEDFEQPYEQQFFISDGTAKTVMMSTNAVMSGGQITGFEHVARDVTQEKQQRENVRSYIQQITRAQEEERKRIARDLHDDVSPDIIILIQKLDNLAATPRLKLATVKENLQDLRSQAVESLEALRATAQGLRPRIIDDLGLVAALEWIAEELEKDQEIQTRVEARGMERSLSPETQIVLFRIAQEALNNIRKHAKASLVTIRLEGSDHDISLTVTDNGQGFEVPIRAEDMVRAGRLGLMGMYERARLLNGNLQIKSAPGKGTELTVRLPWHAGAA